ncbi:MAG: AgmX/PglI C-terminal domain-containing protein [Desulfosarcinaceae bacterium]
MTPPIQNACNLKRSTEPSPSPNSESARVAQFFIFKGVTFIGQDCYSQERISIGSSAGADLILEDNTIAPIQAYVYLKEGQIIISDQTAKGVRVNGIFQKTAMLRPLDLVDIGPFTLKIKAISSSAATSGATAATTSSQAATQARPHSTVTSEVKGSDSVKRGVKRSAASEPIAKTSSQNADDERPEEDSSDAFADFFQFYPDPATVNYDIVFYGQMRPAAKPEQVKAGLQHLFRAGPRQIESLFQQPRVVIKKNISYQKAQQLKTVFEKTGAKCHLEPVDDQRLRVEDFEAVTTQPSVTAPPSESPPTPKPTSEDTPPAADIGKSLESEAVSGSSALIEDKADIPKEAPSISKQAAEAEAKSDPASDTVAPPDEEQAIPEISSHEQPSGKNPFATVGIYDDDDEEDDDDEADFHLKDQLIKTGGPVPAGGDTQVEVIKLRNEQVIDIRYLRKRQRYTIDWDGRKFCLVESRRNAPALFYFNDRLGGRIESAGEGIISTNRLMRDLTPWRKRKNLFRRELPTDGCALIHDGDFEYRLSVCELNAPADVKLPPKEKRHPYKHAATSLVFHLVFIAFLGLFPSFNADDGDTESHFVQLDQSQLTELEKIIKPKPIKPTPPPPPPPKKVAPPPKPVVKKQTPVTKVKPNRVKAKKKTKGAKVASVSRHPKAGGGFGKGNVVNRDVNQTGLLSMIGDSVGFQPQAAVAAVTNLDAVTAPGGVNETNFKVGGIVGKLGPDKISVPTGGTVATKGSKQVLRSIGASGPGKVAALEKGEIGQRQVAGTVTASLTKSVLIQGGGGMSRQAVKRVIDQHLDEVTYCYETALISNPSIMGKMIFEWRILMNGEVGEVRIKNSTVNSNEIHACIKAAIKTWQFPKPKGSTVVVSYPFIFDVVGF